MTNPDTVERLRELLGKATEGPWVENTHDIWTVRADGQPGIPLLREEIGSYRSWGRATTHEEREANAALIVEAINALPALLAVVEALPPLLSEAHWLARQATNRGDIWKDEQWVRDSSVGRAYTKAATALATLKGEG